MVTQSSPKMKSALRRVISLKPYGSSLLTPAAATWFLIARVLIFLMAASEAVSWGYIGGFFLSGWYAALSAGFTATVIFFVVWGADVNLMTLDRARPFYEKRLYERVPESAWKDKAKTISAFASRWFIVVVSLVITAPFLSQIVFSVDINKELEREGTTQIEKARQAVENQFSTPIKNLQDSINKLQTQVTDEIAGRPNSRTRKFGDGPVAKSIKDQTSYQKGEMQKFQVRRDTELQSFDAAVSTKSYDELGSRWGVILPANSIIKRGEILDKIMEVPTFARTEWAIRAFLGFLFLSLFILKMFEPRSVKIYLSEAVQQEWQRYLTGAFDTWVAYHEKSQAPHCTMTPYRFEDLMINSYPAIRREDLIRRASETVEREAREGLETLSEIESEMEEVVVQVNGLRQELSKIEDGITEAVNEQGAFPTKYAQQQDEIAILEEELTQISSSLQARRGGSAITKIEMLQLLEEETKAALHLRDQIETERRRLGEMEQLKAVNDTKLIPLYDKRKHLVAQIAELQAKIQNLVNGKDEIRNRRVASAVNRGVGKTA
jgi:hypothetical protein